MITSHKTISVVFLLFVVACLSVLGSCGKDESTNEPAINKAPTCNITSPADSATFVEGQTINFSATATDFEDGNLAGGSLVWTSDQDGSIGTGNSFGKNSLSVNTHLIELKVTDSDGSTDSDSITIQVTSGPVTGAYDLIPVPATSGYLMGWAGVDADEEPVHTVSLNEFNIGKYEVTYALWTEVKVWAESNGYTFSFPGQQGSGSSTTDQHPVVYVSWRDCIAWCNAYSEKEGLTPVYYTDLAQLTPYRNSSTDGDIGNDHVDWVADGFRLPTEAEWEYAARYMDGASISSGAQHSGFNLYPDIVDCAWYYGNSSTGTHPIGQLQANSLGAKDMSGNAAECCWDWYADYPSASQDNPSGPTTGTFRARRSGSWGNYATRSADRDRVSPGSAGGDGGFRLCRGDLTP